MEYGDGLEKAHSLATEALELMRKHEIPATPQNFAVWYAYAGEKFPDLRSALDTMISGDTPFTASRNEEVFDRFFTHSDEGYALQETGRRIEDQMDLILGLLGEVSEDADDFEESLKEGLGTIAQTNGLEGITAAVQHLVLETQKMQASNKELKAKLENSSNEVEVLRRNLEDVQREAMTDALTGIANRKMFDAALRHATVEATETREPLCLALIDIDHFKHFNDSYGHQTGDQVLKLVARIMKENVKGRDIAARYGGEEFGIILPRTTLQDAKTVCEQIRLAVSSKRIRNRQTGEEMGNITLSLGIAIHIPSEPLAELIHRADESLYFAKRNGRNQTALESQLSSIAVG